MKARIAVVEELPFSVLVFNVICLPIFLQETLLNDFRLWKECVC